MRRWGHETTTRPETHLIHRQDSFNRGYLENIGVVSSCCKRPRIYCFPDDSLGCQLDSRCIRAQRRYEVADVRISRRRSAMTHRSFRFGSVQIASVVLQQRIRSRLRERVALCMRRWGHETTTRPETHLIHRQDSFNRGYLENIGVFIAMTIVVL
ncbi:uncharacterized protein LOC105194211 isoform X2 [Solenopsis invicta]|uniref:uncharacterized protein LOC105194211 isoform X2 n=1 Tax=Solenopsis invicta TaxID=13686 RepID=UPI00193E49E2|nr:uncharacterized protein LOC105194211 isoform X2 [Solenopsis invicta]